MREAYLNSRHEHQGHARAALHLARVPRRLGRVRALQLAGRIRRAGHQGNGLERPVGGRRHDAARQHGPAALRAARRERLGARARVVLDRVDALAHELRRHAHGQPALQPAAGRGAGAHLAGSAARVPPEALLAPRRSRPTRRRRCSTTCGRAARGPAATRNWPTRPRASARLIVGSSEYQFN